MSLPPGWGRRLALAGLLALPSLLALCFMELTLRAHARLSYLWENPPHRARIEDFGYLLRQSAHPEIGLEMRPHLDVFFRGRPFQTNAAGYRDRPHAARKRPGVLRIVGLGDSVMMGWGVGQGEDYLSLLEGALRARGHDVEVLNFAVGGYNTVQEYHVMRDVALGYDPDVVVLGYVGNDLEDASFRRPRTRFDSPSALVNLGVLAWRRRTGALAPNETHDWRPFRRDLADLPADFDSALDSIAALCRRRGLPAVMVLDSRYESPFIEHRQVVERARALGFRTLDLMSLYRRLAPGTPIEEAAHRPDEHNRTLILKDDRHPNALWHRRTARTLADLLLREGLVAYKGAANAR
jgi:hypothetical protein